MAAKVRPLRYIANMHDSPCVISHVFRINNTYSSIQPVAGSLVPGTNNAHIVCVRMSSSSAVHIPRYFPSIQTCPAPLPLSANLPGQAPGRVGAAGCLLRQKKTRHAAAEPAGKARPIVPGQRPQGTNAAQRPCASLPRRAGPGRLHEDASRLERAGAGFMVSAYKKTRRDAASRRGVAEHLKCGNANGDWFSDLW